MERIAETLLAEQPGYLGTWVQDEFKLRLWDTGGRLGSSVWDKARLRYEFYDDEFSGGPLYGEPLFAGDDYGPSPLHGVDSDDAVAGLLSFLALRPGDTDAEYFDDYTDSQRRWLESGRPDELQMIVFDLENPPAELNLGSTGSSPGELEI